MRGEGPRDADRRRSGRMAEAYCVKDRKMMEIKNPQNITMKNGKPAITGTCENGHKVFRIGKG
jgi:hypothetical protein